MNQRNPSIWQGLLSQQILVVDDEPYVTAFLSRMLKAEGFACEVASSAEEAWPLLEAGAFSLLLTDITMPGKSGIELLGMAKAAFAEQVAVVMITAVDDRKTAIRALEMGAYGYVVKPFERNEMMINVANALERRRLVLEGLGREQWLESEVRKRTAEIRHREEEIALHLVYASERRDNETGAHIKRIGLYAALLAKALAWDSQRVDDIRVAAPMHDVGKIGVPDNILLKPGKLTPEEFDVMKQHTTEGASILEGSDIPLLRMARDIALSHHEKWDGSGYPQRLREDAIPDCARLVAICDVYDALRSHRVYRAALSAEEGLSIMIRDRGTHFDPMMFDNFLAVLPEFHRILGQVTG